MKREIYVNIPVKDLSKSKEFFTKLGFSFNPEFTDNNAACLVIEENIYFMLVNHEMYKGFTPGKEICDTKEFSEAILGISAKSREEVDEVIGKVLEAGGQKYREPFDYGWMYGQAFTDLDGHIWEIFYLDEEKRIEMRDKK